MNRNELLLRVYGSADLQGCLHVKFDGRNYKISGIIGVWVLVAELVQLGRAIASGAGQECRLEFFTVERERCLVICYFSGREVEFEILVQGRRKVFLQLGAREFVLAVEGLDLHFPRFF